MSNEMKRFSIRTGVVTFIFAGGFFCGSLTQRNADADWKAVGSAVLNQAAESNASVANVVQLGKTLSDMEKNVSAMQQNIDTLKKVQSALTIKK